MNKQNAPQSPTADWLANSLVGFYTFVTGTVSGGFGLFWTMFRFFLNKAVAIALLGYGYYRFDQWQDDAAIAQAIDPRAAAPPFGEIYYAGLSFGAAILLGLFVRLLVFPEAAEYAEKGMLREDMEGGTFRVRTVQYWVATILCLGGALICMFNLPK